VGFVRARGSVRLWSGRTALFVCVLLVSAVVWKRAAPTVTGQPHPAPAVDSPSDSASVELTPGSDEAVLTNTIQQTGDPPSADSSQAADSSDASPAPSSQSSPQAIQLVQNLISLVDPSQGGITEERATQWKQSLKQLIQEG